MALKVVRLTPGGTPVYDCHVFAVYGACIKEDVNITGDFIGEDKITINGSINADGIAYIGEHCKVGHINACEGIFIDDFSDTCDLTSPEDIEVGDNVQVLDISSYGNVKIGVNAIIDDVEVWNGNFELESSDGCGRIQVGKP